VGGGKSKREVKIRILEAFGLNVSRSTVHREMQKMKFSYITPRPVHHKQDPKKTRRIKKKSQ
jgi:transposase